MRLENSNKAVSEKPSEQGNIVTVTDIKRERLNMRFNLKQGTSTGMKEHIITDK